MLDLPTYFDIGVIVLSGAHSASDGEVSTSEGNIKVRFEAVQAEEISNG